MRDKLIFYAFWTVVLGAALVVGFYVAERIVTWFSASMARLFGG